MIQVQESAFGGQGLYAATDISVGQTILKEATPIAQFETQWIRQSVLSQQLRLGGPKDDSGRTLAQDIQVPSSVKKEYGIKFQRMVVLAVRFVELSRKQKETLLDLYAPNTSQPSKDEAGIVQLSKEVIQFLDSKRVTDSSLDKILKESRDELSKILLVWACNSFAGGRIYATQSRANHSCNPNAIVSADGDCQSLKAVVPIAKGDEITISYLNPWLLYADCRTRQKLLLRDKFFHCQCERCTGSQDRASSIPCFSCHPRQGPSLRQLLEDVQYDDDQTVQYIWRVQDSTGNDSLHCGKTDFRYYPGGKGGKNSSEHTRLFEFHESLVDKLTSFLEQQYVQISDSKGTPEDRDLLDEQLDQQLTLASSVLGARHWTTNVLLYLQLDRLLQQYHGSLLKGGSDLEPDTALEMIAEGIDMLQRVCRFAEGLSDEVSQHYGHWLSDVIVGTARALVSLGDDKSQNYAVEWLNRVDNYIPLFEDEIMQKVVQALKDARKRTNEEQVVDERPAKLSKRDHS